MKRAQAHKILIVLSSVSILLLLAVDARAFGDPSSHSDKQANSGEQLPSCVACAQNAPQEPPAECPHSPSSRSGMQQQPLPYASLSESAGRLVLSHSGPDRGSGFTAVGPLSKCNSNGVSRRVERTSQCGEQPRHPAIGQSICAIAPPAR